MNMDLFVGANWEFRNVLHHLLVAAGIGQLILCLASPAIPVVLAWPRQLKTLSPLLRQVFWTYAGYILGSHVVFGVLSVAAPGWLLDGTGMAAFVSGYVACWWGVRLVLHLAVFDVADLPDGRGHLLAKHGLGLLFVGLTVVYGTVFIFNLGGLR